MRSVVAGLERHQLWLYLAALALGAVLGLLVPAVAQPAEATISPVLGLLLYATFLGVPFARLARAVRDWRFLATALAVNFVAVPFVVFGLSRIAAHDRVLLVGVTSSCCSRRAWTMSSSSPAWLVARRTACWQRRRC